MMSRRQWFKTALAALGAFSANRSGHVLAAPTEIKLPPCDVLTAEILGCG